MARKIEADECREAWAAADAAAAAARVEIRRLLSLEDADDAIRIMSATWGPDHVIPRELLRAFQTAGCLVQGAYRDGVMIGFVLGFHAVDGEGLHEHSDRLAVLLDERASGVGFALKMAQRAAALDDGVGLIRWTFDPMISRNAHLNLRKLGASVDAFERNFYGRMAGVLDANDRSDRMWVRWDLSGERPQVALEEAVVVLDRAEDGRPVAGSAPATGVPALVRIPREYQDLHDRDLQLAGEWREATAVAMEACFGAGLVAVDFLPDSSYVFATVVS